WVAPGFAGYCAVIDHDSFIGIYGHCKDGSAKVTKGARVREGQVFILSGNTGGSTGPHLHFEILPDGYVLNSRFYGRVNPVPYLGA
ncbi:M23 family metallopeptidase, partial [Burkholderia sp. SIMBA_057]